jgi:hypothetical protein
MATVRESGGLIAIPLKHGPTASITQSESLFDAKYGTGGRESVTWATPANRRDTGKARSVVPQTIVGHEEATWLNKYLPDLREKSCQ